jgi:hypothetical protein
MLLSNAIFPMEQSLTQALSHATQQQARILPAAIPEMRAPRAACVSAHQAGYTDPHAQISPGKTLPVRNFAKKVGYFLLVSN